MRPWPEDRLAFGGDYNPEQWPRSTWREDMELMLEAGVSFVTLGVFSWSWLEPAKGEYDFAWLDEAMDLLHDNGIAVDLATATATPPPWLSVAHPEILPVDRDGHTLWPGSRQTWCPSSPVYRDHALALTTQLAQRYHDHPALALWHVSNEYACHNLPCYCDTCAAAFRRWLRGRYATVDDLNDAWGTAFWSQRYTDWEQVLPPRRTTTFANPTHQLDYAGSAPTPCSTSTARRRRSCNEHSPGVPVTTNFMTLTHFRHLDYHQWAPEQDVISTDHYVVNRLAHPRAELSFSGDLTRGLAGGRPVAADGALDQRRQLAAGQPRQGPRPDHPRQPRPRRPGRRHHRLLPVAPVALGLGEVPLGPGPPRRPRQRALPRGLRARRHRAAAR